VLKQIVAANGRPPLGLRLLDKLVHPLMRHAIQTEKELPLLPPPDQPGGHSPVADDMRFTSSAHAAAEKERSRRLLAAAKEHGVKGNAVFLATAVFLLAVSCFKVLGERRFQVVYMVPATLRGKERTPLAAEPIEEEDAIVAVGIMAIEAARPQTAFWKLAQQIQRATNTSSRAKELHRPLPRRVRVGRGRGRHLEQPARLLPRAATRGAPWASGRGRAARRGR
jgi:hypothetical protein